MGIIEDKRIICSQALMTWLYSEIDNEELDIKEKDKICNIFPYNMILNKLDNYGVKVVLPDLLLMIVSLCTDNNPGISQIIIKELLSDIKEKQGNIPEGYIITSSDFVNCFPENFPILDIPEVYDKYIKLWDGQKRERPNEFSSDNLCDTPEWWLEVMEK